MFVLYISCIVTVHFGNIIIRYNLLPGANVKTNSRTYLQNYGTGHNYKRYDQGFGGLVGGARHIPTSRSSFKLY